MVNENKISGGEAPTSLNALLLVSNRWSLSGLKLSSKLVLECLVYFFIVPILSPKLFVASVCARHFDIAIEVLLELFEVVVLLKKLVDLLLLLLVVKDCLGPLAF